MVWAIAECSDRDQAAPGFAYPPEGDVEHQSAVALNRDECVAVAKVLIVLGSHALLFLSDEGPKFVAFHVAHLHAAYFLGHESFAPLASQNQQAQSGSAVDTSHTLDCRNAGVRAREPFSAFSYGQVRPIQWVFAGVRERLAAPAALVAVAVLALTEFAAFGAANCGKSPRIYLSFTAFVPIMGLRVNAASAVMITGREEVAASTGPSNWSRRWDLNPRSWNAPPCRGDGFAHFPTSAKETGSLSRTTESCRLFMLSTTTSLVCNIALATSRPKCNIAWMIGL
jgi:hypothetical protein